MTRRVNVGIIGTGGIAQCHLRAYSEMPGVKILAVADIIQERAEGAAQRWEVPNYFVDYHELLEIDEIEAVSVCTYNQAHRAPTVDALEAGKHVLVEKPMAATLEDATAMVRAARRSGKILMVAFHSRFRPDMKAAKSIVDSGVLGDIYYAETGGGRRRGIPGGTFVRKDTAGGGAVVDIGVYSLDTALYLMGHPLPTTVSAITNDYIGTHSGPPIGSVWKWNPEELEVEDFGAAWIRFDTGAILLFRTAWSMHADTMGSTYFLGVHGGLKLHPLEVYTDRYGYMVDITPKSLPPEPDIRELFRNEISPFIEAVREGQPSPVDPEGVLLTNVIMDGIYRSAELGHEVEVEVPEV